MIPECNIVASDGEEVPPGSVPLSRFDRFGLAIPPHVASTRDG